MRSMHFKGRPVPDDSSKVCILYDAKTGRVVHVHGVTVLEGGQPISESELEERARSRAVAIGRSVSGLKILHLRIPEIPQEIPLIVNPEGTGLISVTQQPKGFRDLLSEYRAKQARR
jgi:hypothetical protein